MKLASHQVTLALWQAWHELNTIRARDGVPYTRDGWKASVDGSYFSKVVDDCEAALEALTGEPPKPWPPRDSAMVAPGKERS